MRSLILSHGLYIKLYSLPTRSVLIVAHTTQRNVIVETVTGCVDKCILKEQRCCHK